VKAFVIYLKGKEHSERQAHQMLDQLQEWNIDASLFPGTQGDDASSMANKGKKTLYPFSIKSKELTDLDLQKYIKPELYETFIQNHHYIIHERHRISDEDVGKMSRPGVIGCFYSHYRLWEKCTELDEPIMIFEDDVKFYRNYLPVEFEDVLILSLGKKSFKNEPYKTYLESPCAPPQAVPWKNASMPGTSGYAITPRAASGLVKTYRYYWCPSDNAINQFVCKIQIHNHLMGRHTLPNEGNISMTKSKDWD
jgi:hypothetical protein